MDNSFIPHISDRAMGILYKEEYSAPEIVCSFFNALVCAIKPNSIYIPFAKTNDLVSISSDGIDLDYSNPSQKICDDIFKQTGIVCIDSKLVKKKYDCIFSDLPFMPITSKAMNAQIAEIAFDNLCQNGIAAFTFPSGITFNSQGRKWLDKLEKKSIFVDAIIDLPSGAYSPMTMVDSRVLLFSREATEDVLLAKIKDERDIEAIVSNFINHTDSDDTRLGKWFHRGQYADYSSFENENRIKRLEQKLVKAFNGNLKQLQDVCTVIEPPKNDGFNKDVDASVYIPKIGKSAVVTRISELEIKAHNYFRVIVNQDEILPEFLAFILNTELGIELRLRAMGGSTIPFINTKSLSRISVPVPDITLQRKILSVESELSQLSQEVSHLYDRFKTTPAAYKSIQKEILNVNNHGDKFEQWFETLPYPIATILKRFQVTGDDEHRQEALLFFFEAYSIFQAAILIGAYGKYYKFETEVNNVKAASFEQAQFGSWVMLDRAISKTIRKELDDHEMMDKVFERFHTDERNVIM